MELNINSIKRKLLIKYGFFGNILANTTFEETKTVDTAATDGKNIYYNSEFTNSLTEKEQIFLFAHELCHIALNHIYRSEGKDHETWNTATDAVINSYLTQKDGLPLIEGGVDIKDAYMYDAEQLYEKLLKEKQDNENENKKSKDNNNSNEDNQVGHDSHTMWEDAVKKKHKQEENKENHSTPKEQKIEQDIEKMGKIGEKKIFEENERLRNEQLEKLRKSLAQQSTSYGNSSLADQRNISDIGSAIPLINWTRLLKSAIKTDEDWSYLNPEVESGIIMPTIDPIEKNETEIVLDTSGSIDDDLLRNFLRECKNILKESKVKVGCFDTKFYGFSEVKSSKDIENLKFQGGGGTDFDAAVNAFSKNANNKIIFTDGWASMPQKKVDAIWIIFGGRKINPLGGRVIYISDEDLKRLANFNKTKRNSR
jgi:predicted metal-dependent peptidase